MVSKLTNTIELYVPWYLYVFMVSKERAVVYHGIKVLMNAGMYPHRTTIAMSGMTKNIPQGMRLQQTAYSRLGIRDIIPVQSCHIQRSLPRHGTYIIMSNIRLHIALQPNNPNKHVTIITPYISQYL